MWLLGQTDPPSVAYIVALTAAIMTPLTAIVTVLFTKGVDALIRIRADGRIDKKTEREDKKEDHAGEIEQYRFFIAELEKENAAVKDDWRIIHKEHVDCVRIQGELRGEVSQVRAENSQYRVETANLRVEVSLLRVELAKHTALAKEAAARAGAVVAQTIEQVTQAEENKL